MRSREPSGVVWRAVTAANGAYNKGRYYLDPGKFPDGLELRGFAPGDRFQAEGWPKAKKVKDLFQRARVPVWRRAAWPVLASGGALVWMRGLGVAAGMAAEAGAKKFVEVVDPEWDEEITTRAANKWNQKSSNGRLCKVGGPG